MLVWEPRSTHTFSFTTIDSQSSETPDMSQTSSSPSFPIPGAWLHSRHISVELQKSFKLLFTPPYISKITSRMSSNVFPIALRDIGFCQEPPPPNCPCSLPSILQSSPSYKQPGHVPCLLKKEKKKALRMHSLLLSEQSRLPRLAIRALQCDETCYYVFSKHTLGFSPLCLLLCFFCLGSFHAQL